MVAARAPTVSLKEGPVTPLPAQQTLLKLCARTLVVLPRIGSVRVRVVSVRAALIQTQPMCLVHESQSVYTSGRHLHVPRSSVYCAHLPGPAVSAGGGRDAG